ncbi:protein PALS2-like [Paramacrobiotus metropolitanus]|uniref:protein PALS2-like n=1 Tax=Paramacrobiotus metropolitanus TaxID=2943436 RepID=UPI002445E961|nr:protein PALS2-like [Paramacrobiotus metropolitanus]
MDEEVIRRMVASFSRQDLARQRPGSAMLAEAKEPVNYNVVDLVCEVITDLEIRGEDGDSVERQERKQDVDIQELTEILYSPDFQALMESHDMVANKTFEPAFMENLAESFEQEVCPFPGPDSVESVVYDGALMNINGTPTSSMPASTPMFEISGEDSAVKVVGIRRGRNSNLQGMTVRVDDNQLVVARILVGSPVDKQGLLHVGDIIKEVNGHPVQSCEAFQQAVLAQTDTVIIRIIPALHLHPATTTASGQIQPTYLKAYFNYEPSSDPLLPAAEALGLPFGKGDILEILNVDEEAFWQARHLNDTGSAKLIPSPAMQEQRNAASRAQPRHCWPRLRNPFRMLRKHRILYGDRPNWIEIDRHELLPYEEVMRLPAFQRKTLVLIGPLGNARRQLLSRMLKTFPDRYGYPIPRTSRPSRPNEINGRQYYFCTVEEMKRDIGANQYAEFGMYNGHYYGTKLDSIRLIILNGKTCILDCGPQCLKLLRNKEFLPYVVFVTHADFAEPVGHRDDIANGTLARTPRRQSRSLTIDNLKSHVNSQNHVTENLDLEDEAKLLLDTYEPLVDLILDQEDLESAFEQLLRGLTAAELEDQWVPVSWIY